MFSTIRTTAAAALLALFLLTSGCGQEQSEKQLSASDVMPDMTGADQRLVDLTDQADDLLPGGRKAFEARIKELRGLPVVVNKWASWCAPCRDEAPVFQRTARELGNRVAFLGINASDTSDGSEAFRKQFPLPFPSYDDPKFKIAAVLPPADKQPMTGIFDRDGRLVHVDYGAYDSVAQLTGQIERYAGPLD